MKQVVALPSNNSDASDLDSDGDSIQDNKRATMEQALDDDNTSEHNQ